MVEFFNKLKENIDKVGVKAKETIEITKIKGQISKILEQKRKALEELGVITYEMIIDENVEIEKLKEKVRIIKSFDLLISEKEKEILEIQAKTQQEISRLKTVNENKCECGATIPEGSKFCIKCGQKIKMPKTDSVYCECGETISEGSKFCVNCGRQIANTM